MLDKKLNIRIWPMALTASTEVTIRTGITRFFLFLRKRQKDGVFRSVPDMMWCCATEMPSEPEVHRVVWCPLVNYFLFGFFSSIRPKGLSASLWHRRNKPARVNKSHNSLICESERLSNSETQIINLITNECLLAYFMSCEWSNEVYYYDSIFFLLIRVL